MDPRYGSYSVSDDIEGGGKLDDATDWITKNPTLVLGILVALVVLVIWMLWKSFNANTKDEKFGGGNLLASRQFARPRIEHDQAYFLKERFGSGVTGGNADLAPVKTPIYDGQDTHGKYRIGSRSRAKYYLITDANGRPATDPQGYVLYVKGAAGLSALAKTTGQQAVNTALYDSYDAVDAYARTCSAVSDYSAALGTDPYAWTVGRGGQLAKNMTEGFSAMDQKLVKSMRGH